MSSSGKGNGDINTIFEDIYEKQTWYGGGSGEGSTLEFNMKAYIPFVREYIDRHRISRVVDIGSGDGQCLHALYQDKAVMYHGYDCSKTIVTQTKRTYENEKYRFELIDGNAVLVYVRKDTDLVIIKDVLQHWSTSRIVRFLKELCTKVRFRKCLLVNDMGDSETLDIVDGSWRCINWNSPCFDEFSFKTELIYGNSLLKEVVEFRGIKARTAH